MVKTKQDKFQNRCREGGSNKFISSLPIDLLWYPWYIYQSILFAKYSPSSIKESIGHVKKAVFTN